MVVGFTTICGAVPITTKVVSSNPAHGEVLLDTTLCDNFVSYLPQVSGFLRIKLTTRPFSEAIDQQ
jgi:hypothetical protein